MGYIYDNRLLFESWYCCRRKRAGLPPLPDEHLIRAIRRLKFSSAALAVVPTGLSLSSGDSWKSLQRVPRVTEAGPVRYASRYEQTPEQRVLAQRQLAIGMRTAAYGTMLTALTVAGGVTLIAWRNDLRDWGDCRRAMRRWGQGLRPRIQATMAPWRDYARSLVPRRSDPDVE